MFNSNAVINLIKNTFLNSYSKSAISTKPNIKMNNTNKATIGLTNKEIEELLLESRMKRYGVSRELLLEAALYNVDWDFQKNGTDGLENAIEEAKRIDREARNYMYHEYSQSRL